MSCSLGSGFQACVVQDHVILLDVARDRYHALGPRARDAFVALLRGPVHPDQASALTQLLEDGILCGDPSRGRLVLPATAPEAARDLLPVPRDVPLAARGHAVRFRLAATLALRTGRLRGARRWLDRQSRARAAPTLDADERLLDLMAAFHRLEWLFPTLDRCLVHSVACCGAGRSAGLALDFVIGVRAAPFAAHCWVQQGSLVVNDTVERVRPFTPLARW